MKEVDSPATQFQFYLIERAANRLLSYSGVEGYTHVADDPTAQEVTTVRMPIAYSSFAGEVEENRLPTLRITRPANPDDVTWDFEMAYGMQDADRSCTILIGNDPIIGKHAVVSYSLPEEQAPDLLSSKGAERVIEDLDRQVDMFQDHSVAA